MARKKTELEKQITRAKAQARRKEKVYRSKGYTGAGVKSPTMKNAEQMNGSQRAAYLRQLKEYNHTRFVKGKNGTAIPQDLMKEIRQAEKSFNQKTKQLGYSMNPHTKMIGSDERVGTQTTRKITEKLYSERNISAKVFSTIEDAKNYLNKVNKDNRTNWVERQTKKMISNAKRVARASNNKRLYNEIKSLTPKQAYALQKLSSVFDEIFAYPTDITRPKENVMLQDESFSNGLIETIGTIKRKY